MMIINDDSSIVNKLGASLTDDARVVIYDHHMFIGQATSSFPTPTNLKKWAYHFSQICVYITCNDKHTSLLWHIYETTIFKTF
jgi:hypothetical protein